jgi:hypothetical protein
MGKARKQPAIQRKTKKARPSTPEVEFPNTGSEPIPPGATARAANRPINPGGGPPGSGAGPRHAADDEGSADEEYGPAETNQRLAEDPVTFEPTEDPLEQGPPYSGISGGAVGGTPAEGRSKGGRTRHGIASPGAHRGDSTIGADPDRDEE